MVTQSQAKGDELEAAVRAIESVILRSFPGYSEETFKIEGKKIIRSGGVKHEIDIFVSLELSKGYSACFIFECKNWKEKVGKNEVVVFSEKIDVCSAQRGFFVAKSFTSDAHAQAAKDSRLELLLASDLDPSAVLIPCGFHAIELTDRNATVNVKMEVPEPTGESVPLDLGQADFEIDGEPLSLAEYVDEWSKACADSASNKFNSTQANEGPHQLPFADSRSFANSCAKVNGDPVAEISIKGTATVIVHKAYVVSAYELEGRGRVVNVRVSMQGAEFDANFVSLAQ